MATRFLAPGSRAWIALLAALNAIAALSVDMSLPAQPRLSSLFGVSDATAGLTLSLFLGGFAIGQLLVGYLSDARGRRSVLLAGLGGFVFAGAACTFAPSIEMLIAFRMVQGLTAAAAPVLVRAMARDTLPGAGAAKLLAGFLAVLAIAPMLAPTIGAGMIALVGWRGIFATLTVTGAILWVLSARYLGDTLPPERRAVPTLRGMLGGYAEFFRTPGTRLPMLVSCCTFAAQFAYVNASPAVLMKGFGVPSEYYGACFAMTAIALMGGSLAGRRMLDAGRSAGALLVVGASISVCAGVLVAITTRIPALGLAGFLLPMVVFFFGSGMSGPSAAALAMEPVPHIAGTASSVVGFLTTMSGAIAGYATSAIGGSSPRIFSLVAMVMGIAAWGFAIFASVARRWRRLRSNKSRGSRTSDSDSARAPAA